nr:MAG TPA: hypothetical protein [Caudoviricetes sp.]
MSRCVKIGRSFFCIRIVKFTTKSAKNCDKRRVGETKSQRRMRLPEHKLITRRTTQ